MPSDTFAAGIDRSAIARIINPLAWSDAERSEPGSKSRIIATAHCNASIAKADEIIRRLAPTDTDTAIPAGECRCARQHDPDQLDHQSHCAASPKPDTDTPVDPGVEGVRDRFRKYMGTTMQPADLEAYCRDLEAACASTLKQADQWRFIANEMGYEPRSHQHAPLSPWLQKRIAMFRALAAKPIAGMGAGEVDTAHQK